MPFSGNGKFLSQLLEKAAPVETDNLMVSDGDDLKKSTLKNILEKVSFPTLKTTAKNITGAINELNTNTLVTGAFSGSWVPGFAIDGMGFTVMVPKHYKSHTLTVSSAKIFVPASKSWVSTPVSSITDLVNCWRIILTTDASMKLTSGSAYITSLDGQIK